jgi:arylsulfatase A-like enzyme
MARRLVEAGVPSVEVVMGDGVGWDTHRDNFPRTRALSVECDTAMSALVENLDRRGLLGSTLVVWMGEFGRTPRCSGGGRNHWARAWSSVLVGGGIKGGRVVSRTDRDGAAVIDRPVSVTDFLATVYTVLGIDYTRKNHPRGWTARSRSWTPARGSRSSRSCSSPADQPDAARREDHLVRGQRYPTMTGRAVRIAACALVVRAAPSEQHPTSEDPR